MPSSHSDLKFKGYAVKDPKKWDQLEVIEYTPKTKGDRDVDIKIECCGVCASDLHTISGGWGEPILPIIPGHEIVGKVVSVGPKVSEFKPGDRVGVGPMVGSCFDCSRCRNNNENYCLQSVDTYNSKYPNGDVSQGGYATAIRVDERWVMPIPKELESEIAAPMMCAGVTVYSPLVTHGAGPGKTVGVVGIGGLGHFAVQFAKALGCDKVIAFSHSEKKKDDAFELGATDFVITSEDNFAEPWAGRVDLIICTINVSDAIPISKLLSTLNVHGKFIMVALPDDPLPSFKGFDLAPSGCLVGGSKIGSKKETVDMLKLAVEKGVKSRIEVLPMKDAGKALKWLEEGKPRYRYVLRADI